MWSQRMKSAFGVCILSLANGANAQEVGAIGPDLEPPAAFMQVFASAEPPHGFVNFCQQTPEECTANSNVEARVAASSLRLRELDETNRSVNEEITPEADLEHYGVNEYWTLPTDGKGDCEDYALLKRHELMRLGWPSSALLMTVVRDERREGHAVLTARTTAGDFILDNKVNDVRLWSNTPYQFLLRQSSANPRAWTSLAPALDLGPLLIAVVRQHRYGCPSPSPMTRLSRSILTKTVPLTSRKPRPRARKFFTQSIATRMAR
jgi:predicted transglutaminase-like cysteine proteinase